MPAIAGSFTTLKKRGSEYVARCCFHTPDNNPSLSLFQKNGKWNFKCFSCGESGDALDFIEKAEGLDTAQAMKRLNGGSNWTPRVEAPKRVAPPERVTSAPPKDAPAPDMAMRGLGDPSRIWPYRDAEGALIGYVCRYETKDGKEFRPWTWGAIGAEAPRWKPSTWNKPRPIYGLERLAARPEVPVIVCEGEKAADAAQELLPQYAAIAWPGGTSGWRYTDLSPLRSRRVDLWPDNDEPGIEAMRGLQALLEDPAGLACRGKFIDPNRMPDGFDAADWTAEHGEPIKWLRARASEYPVVVAPVASGECEKTPAAGADSPLPPSGDPAPIPPSDDIPPEAYEDEEEESDAVPMSEDMLAERFADAHEQNWRYVKPWNSWFQWREDGWYRDDTGLIDRLAVELTRKAVYWDEAKALSPAAVRQVNSRRTAGSVRDIAMTDRRIAAKIDQWDTNLQLLGVPSGVVDLRTGEMSKPKRDDFITKRTACAPIAGTPHKWLAVLDRITGGDESLVEYLQRFSGYSLTGETSEHALAFLYGTGANGKTTFLHTISGIMGDYALSAGFEVLAESKGDRHPTEIARLRGARLVVTEETDAGGRWNEGRVKRLTGGGKISAHFMRQDDFEFEPQFKLLIAGNHKPVIKAVDEAIKRRIHLIPFTVTIPPEERDTQLLERLKTEWPQILNWMIDGCMQWRERSLSPSERIKSATEQYVEQEDILGAWIDECCEREGETEGKTLYESYRKWCDAQGEHAWSRRGWSNAMLERGFGQKKSHGQRIFIGISSKPGAHLQ